MQILVEVAATPEQVWAVVSDFSRHPALAASGEVLAVRHHWPLAVGTFFARTDRITTVRHGMERTLGNVKAAAESGTPVHRDTT